MTLDDVDNAIVDCYRSFYTAKAMSLVSDTNAARRDYLFRSMKLIMGSSFVRKKMAEARGCRPRSGPS